VVALTGPVTVGIDLGGTKVLGVAVDAAGTVVADIRAETPRPTGIARDDAATTAEVIAGVADRLIDDFGPFLPPRGPVPLGVGLPGLVDKGGRLHSAPHLPWAATTDFTAMLRARLPHCTLVADNDATAAAVAEAEMGAAQAASCTVVLTIGTGIGGGLVMGGKVVRGAHGFAAEIGHMVIDPHGPDCPCGRRGCWELYASGSGLGRLAQEALEEGRLTGVLAEEPRRSGDIPGAEVTQAALRGDIPARELLADVAGWLALGLANLVAVLDPSFVVVGGGLIAAGDLLLGPARVALEELLEAGGRRPSVPLVAAVTGERAGAIGAAINARSVLAGPVPATSIP
jgi:glucokinase